MKAKRLIGHRGVGVRLLIAFFGISAFAVLAVAAAIYAFRANTDVLDRITEQRVPSAVDALELSRQAERIAAAAPDLLTVTSKEQHQALSAIIRSEMLQLESLLAGLEAGDSRIASGPGNPLTGSLVSAVEGLRGSLEALDEVVFGRIDVSDRKKALTNRLLDTQEAIQRLIAPWLLALAAEIAQLKKRINDPGQLAEVRGEAVAALEKAEQSLGALQKTQLEISIIDDTLRQASSAEVVDRLKVLTFRLQRSLSAVQLLHLQFSPKLQPLIMEQFKELRGLVEGPEGIPQTRELELTLLAQAERLLTDEDKYSRQLTISVDSLVSSAKEDILLARKEAHKVQSFSSAVLVGVVVLTLLSSILIVWLYVGRNLVRRLTSLSNSMLAIAGGNLDARIPSGGNDEISRMAEALTVFRDTAIEVKQTNLQEIREARSRLTDAIESISEGFSLYDSEDRLVVCNSRYREILFPGIEAAIEPGMSFESIVRSSAERGLVTEAEGRVEEWIAERLEWHRNPTGPHLQRRAGDRWIQINERKTENRGTVAVYSDVTEIKRAEEALRESEERYALAMKGVNEGLWDWLPDTDEVYISQRFAELAGIDVTQERISVAEWQQRIHPEDVVLQRDAVRTHLRGKAPFYEAEYRVRGPEGEYRWVRDRGLGLRDETGHVYRVAGSMEDMSELKAREEELRAAKEEAERALEELKLTQRSLVQSEKMASLGQLTAGIAHEIKNPLNFINNFARTSNELIDELADLIEPAAAALSEADREDVDDLMETLKGDLGTIREHGERADSIVKGMLLHSRGDTGSAKVTDLNALLAESLNLAYHGQRANTPGFNVTLEQDLDPAVGEFEIVSQEMTRVFVNLLGNAFYAVHEREGAAGDGYTPTVSVTSRMVADDKVEIRVRDNGTGIPAAALDELFNPFFTTKPPGEGTGLGLSISRDIVVDQHGGNIRAESEDGAFTEFIITLPRRGAGCTKAAML